MSSDLALLTLSRARLPDALLRQLLEQHPEPEAALDAASRGAGFELSPASRDWLRRPDRRRLDADLAWLSLPGRHLVAWHDPDYPALLRRSPGPPALLFVAGDRGLLWSAQVGIVGSRRPSPGGRDHARRFARALAGAGWTITSGLAQGIDTAAHEGALDAGRTVAVVGTGPDVAYPEQNGGLMARIAETGAVVSEHPPGTGALPTHFPSRNRIIAGLSLGTLVVEAAMRSGALISARLAAEAGRDVFALPGSIGNPLARGCHRLIRDGAALVEAPDEILATLAPQATRLAEMLRGQLEEDPDPGLFRSAAGQSPHAPDHSRLWSALDHDPTGMDVLAQRTGLTVAALSSMLLIMELEGHVVNDHGRYARRP
jgi:DNA processing protein